MVLFKKCSKRKVPLLMNTKIKYLFILGLFGCNAIQTQSKSTVLPYSLDNSKITIEYQQMSRAVTIGSTAAFSALVIYACIDQHIRTNYLIQEDYLVKNKYPHAQAWYEDLTLKYPEAHFESKAFLQTMYGISARFISWCSTSNQIYFPEASLKEIDSLYRRTVAGETLTDKEKLTLCKEEFILLHEAGHIEKDDLVKRFISMVGLTLGLNGLYLLSTEMTQSNGIVNTIDFNDLNSSDSQAAIQTAGIHFLNKFNAVNRIYTIALIQIIRNQESAADKFAYSQADIDALYGGVSFFESKEMDPLFDIENSKRSPFVETNSTIGTMAQYYHGFFDEITFTIGKNIGLMWKSTDTTRWIYDYLRGSTHPGASVRAQNIKNEIYRRKHSK